MLTLETIESAVSGEYESINQVVTYYSAYIKTICTNAYQNENGMQYGLDEEMYEQIKAKLIEKILEFEFR